MSMLFGCKVCGPATDHGSAPARVRGAKRWRTIDIHCHCMVPEANAMVLKATGLPGGGPDTNRRRNISRSFISTPSCSTSASWRT